MAKSFLPFDSSFFVVFPEVTFKRTDWFDRLPKIHTNEVTRTRYFLILFYQNDLNENQNVICVFAATRIYIDAHNVWHIFIVKRDVSRKLVKLRFSKRFSSRFDPVKSICIESNQCQSVFGSLWNLFLSAFMCPNRTGRKLSSLYVFRFDWTATSKTKTALRQIEDRLFLFDFFYVFLQ